MENKYIITLEEIPFERFHSYNVTSERLYRVQGFNSLVFDGNGLSKLTPYTEPNIEAIRNEAYEKGVQDTKQHWVDAPRSCAYKLGYENGLKAAWDAACKIVNMIGLKRKDIFGYMAYSSIMNKFSATEAIEKIKQCGQEQEKIEYGDEIQFCDGEKALVLDVDDEKLSVVTKRGFTDISMWKGNVTKTGDKYIIIADYLRKIRDGYEF